LIDEKFHATIPIDVAERLRELSSVYEMSRKAATYRRSSGQHTRIKGMLVADCTNRKRSICYIVVGSLVYLSATILLYWDEFAIRGIWPTITRRLISALVFGSLLTIWQSYCESRKQKTRISDTDQNHT